MHTPSHETTASVAAQIEDLDGTALYHALDLASKATTDDIKKVPPATS